MKRAPVRDILQLFIITRLILVAVTYIGYILLTAPKYSNNPVDLIAILASWNHWDAANYVRIAQFGYQTPFDVAFFPLFPLLIKIFAFVLGGWSYLLVGTIISNAALLGALFVLYQLAVEAGGEEVAQRTLIYICIFPTAFYFFAPYNESLFLLLAAGTFLALRRQHWWLAGLLGFFASLTRSPGVLLVVPFLVELWVSRESTTAFRQNILFRILPIVLIPLGTLLYALYCWHISGNLLDFVVVQSHWGRHTAWPWQGIFLSLTQIFWNQPFGSFNEVHNVLDLTATIAFITLAVLGRNKLRASYTIWMAVMLFYILLSPATINMDPLVSNQRFVLELFPAFITLAILGARHSRLHQVIMLSFPSLLATLSILFIMNRWMV
ncbi:MAG TPA: mannosyltransferase family protein [Ktedonobacteraceae bacterium]|nr:mannosyltransferase family protein [Ktedonobacteraceae bacterium]